MKVFFDHQTFVQQNYGGISRYFCELIAGINKTADNEAHLSLLWSNNAHLREYGIPSRTYPFPKRRRLLSTSNRLYNYVDSKVNKYDIYHATYFDDFLLGHIGNRPLVTTFYDMIYERLSDRFVELANDKLIVEQKKKIAQRASHLIAISESTKQDMIELLDIAPEKISVIYLSSPFVPGTTSITTPGHNRPYLLYVGNRAGYKNFNLFLNAISELVKQHGLGLICAGGGAFNREEQARLGALGLQEYVTHRSIDNDQTLRRLYEAAEAFVFPSLYEGFGIPILEAFACGCPCVLSDTSSLPEVAGQAAIYFTPTNEESIRHAVEQVLTDRSLRNRLIADGMKRASAFSWKTTVDQTLAVYRTCL